MALVNKSVVITGGVGAIGEAISTELLKNGVKVLVVIDNYPKEPEIVNKWRLKFLNTTIMYFTVDVTVPKELEDCYAKLFEEITNLDIVVNCAGIYNENEPRKLVEVNLIGVIQSTFIALKYMRADKDNGKGGVILNIASITGIEPISLAPTYSATKHGVIGFTRALAYDRDFLGIKFLTICPGATHSNLYEQIFERSYMCTEELLERLKQKLVLQEPETVGKACVKQIIEGKSGSVWVIEENKITQPVIPNVRV